MRTRHPRGQAAGITQSCANEEDEEEARILRVRMSLSLMTSDVTLFFYDHYRLRYVHDDGQRDS